MRPKVIATLIATVMLAVSVVAQDPAREQKLQQAIDLLETKGDAARAMPLLEDVAKSSDQALAARGLLYLGQAQERGGRDAARKTYERIIQQYPRQSDVVAQARARLTALNHGSPALIRTTATSSLLTTLDDATRPVADVSPDGRYLPVAPQDGSGGVFLQDLVTGTRHLVIRGAVEKGMFTRSLTFSDDGKHVAYASCSNKGGCDLRVMPTRGAAKDSRSLLKEHPFWIQVYDWSSVRSLILFAMRRLESSPIDLVLLSPQTGATRSLASLRQHPIEAAFSPDGNFVAADRLASGARTRDIVVFDLQTSEERAITDDVADDTLVGWTPDGSRVVFTSNRSGVNALWAQSLRSGTQPGAPLFLQRVGERFGSLGITTSGAIFSSEGLQNVQTQIRTVPIDLASGRYEESRAEVVRECYGGSTKSADYASDGRHLAFVCERRIGGRRDHSIVIQPIAGVGREIRPGLSISELRWIPMVSALLVSGSDSTGISGFWRVDVVTGEAALLLRISGAVGAIQGFASDGSRAYIHRRAGVGDERVLVEIDLSTGQVRELFRGVSQANDARTPTVSSDGRRLYYRRSTGDPRPYGNAAFVERDLASGSERLVIEGRHVGRVNLSPDGQFIMTNSVNLETKTRAIILIRVSDGNARELMRLPLPPTADVPSSAPFGVLAWAPDSLSVIVHRNDGAGEPLELWWVQASGQSPPKRLVADWKGQSVRLRPDGGEMAFLNMTDGGWASEIRILEGVIK